MKYESRIELIRDTQRVDAKSILNLLTLAATQGTVLIIKVEGSDAEEAADAITKLVECGFGVAESENSQAEPLSGPDQDRPFTEHA